MFCFVLLFVFLVLFFFFCYRTSHLLKGVKLKMKVGGLCHFFLLCLCHYWKVFTGSREAAERGLHCTPAARPRGKVSVW